MIKKIAILSLSAALLGGCTLADVLKPNNAATDVQSSPTAVSTPAPSPVVSAPPDPELQAMPSTTTGTDDKSLETDINNTKVLNEDFSNIK